MGCGKSKINCEEECDTKHADPIPESIMKKLYNSIVKIEFIDSNKESKRATGFFMRIKTNNKEMKSLFTCKHVISENDINNNLVIDLYFGEKNQEKERKIKLDKKQRFIKAFHEDVILIEIINEDNIYDDKYLTPDLNYEYGYKKYKDKNFYLAGYPRYQNIQRMNSSISYIQQKVPLVLLFVMKMEM